MKGLHISSLSSLFSLLLLLGLYSNRIVLSDNDNNDNKITEFNDIEDNDTKQEGKSSKAVWCGTREAARILIPQKEYPEAMCMDGTRPAFYLRKGKGDGLKKWNIFFEGGGWCYDIDECIRHRRFSDVGSSRRYPSCLASWKMKYYVNGDKERNPMMFNWNTVTVKYCDGGSYASDTDIIHNGVKLHFRGKNNREATIKTLLSIGMNDADEIVISGCSAGGLGIYLGIDEISDIIRQGSKNSSVKIRGMADSGFFLDYTSDSNYRIKKQSDDRGEAIIDGIMDYGSAMRNVFTFMNISSGANKECIDYYRSKGGNNDNNRKHKPEASCMFAENLVPFIKTPMFAVQPRFDQWQIWHVIGKPHDISVVNAYADKMVNYMLKRFIGSKTTTHGGFIDSCTHHCTSCSAAGEDSWHGLNIKSTKEGFTEATSFYHWYHNIEHNDKYFFVQEATYPCSDCCICHA